MGITCKLVKFLQTRRSDCQVAQIVVDENQAVVIENADLWPEGVICRERKKGQTIWQTEKVDIEKTTNLSYKTWT